VIVCKFCSTIVVAFLLPASSYSSKGLVFTLLLLFNCCVTSLRDCCVVRLRDCCVARLRDCCVVKLQGCVIVALQGCVIVALQGCVIIVVAFLLPASSYSSKGLVFTLLLFNIQFQHIV
jgi:hypothetical protein